MSKNNKEQSNELKQNSKFINSTLKKALLPCMLSILSANINVIVDGILVGQKLGSNALAAINLCLPLYLFMCVIGSFIASGTAINASKAIGNRATDVANEYYKLSVVLSFILSIILTVFGYVFLDGIVDFLCKDMMIKPFVYEYSYITFSGVIPKVMIYIPFWYLRLDGKNNQISIMMSIMTIGNIVLDILFVYLLDLRVFGAGLASVVATAIAFAYGAATLMEDTSSFKLHLKLSFNKISWKQLTLDGLPSSFNNLCATFRILLINIMLMNIGGGMLVAIFTAINGVFSIGESIVLGIPQAGTAMLGVYSGEKDYKSGGIIIKSELIIGAILSCVYFAVVMVLSPVLNNVYGIENSIVIPLLWMCLSIFPALICNALSTYYNIHGKNWISILIIFLRVLLMTYIGLVLVTIFDVSTFSFLLFAEMATILVWFILTSVIYGKNKEIHRFLLCSMIEEKIGTVINFSIENNPVKICEGCEQITDFCKNNGFSNRDIMKIQLAMEEVMTLINEVNINEKSNLESFDLRAFNVDDTKGIRIRYDGADFNPFGDEKDYLEYMGIRMIKDLLEKTIYQRTFGVNTLILLLKEQKNV